MFSLTIYIVFGAHNATWDTSFKCIHILCHTVLLFRHNALTLFWPARFTPTQPFVLERWMDLKLFERQSRFNVQPWMQSPTCLCLITLKGGIFYDLVYSWQSQWYSVISINPKHYACLYEHIRRNKHVTCMRKKSPKIALYCSSLSKEA